MDHLDHDDVSSVTDHWPCCLYCKKACRAKDCCMTFQRVSVSKVRLKFQTFQPLLGGFKQHQHGAIDKTGGFKYLLLSSLLGEMFQFDSSNIFNRG